MSSPSIRPRALFHTPSSSSKSGSTPPPEDHTTTIRFAQNSLPTWSAILQIGSPYLHPRDEKLFRDQLQRIEDGLVQNPDSEPLLYAQDILQKILEITVIPKEEFEATESRTPRRWELMWKGIIQQFAINYLQSNEVDPHRTEQTIRLITYFINRGRDASDIDFSPIHAFHTIQKAYEADQLASAILEQATPTAEKSPSTATPSSMSATRSNTRNFSSSYRSHQKLNKAIEELPPTTRKQLLKDLTSACSVMLDSISYKEFRKMSNRNLQLIIKLGPSTPKSCYTVKNIYNLWKNLKGQPLKDPLTRVPVTKAERDEIMKNIKYMKPSAPNPEQQTNNFYPAFHMNIFGPDDGLYFLNVTLQAGSIELVIQDLGFFPENEPHGYHPSSDTTTSALLSRLAHLVQTRKLFQSPLPPIACCHIALPQEPTHWTPPMYADLVQKISALE